MLRETAHAEAAVARDVAGGLLEVTQDNFEESRFTNAVGPHQRHTRGHVEPQVDLMEDGRGRGRGRGGVEEGVGGWGWGLALRGHRGGVGRVGCAE